MDGGAGNGRITSGEASSLSEGWGVQETAAQGIEPAQAVVSPLSKPSEKMAAPPA